MKNPDIFSQQPENGNKEIPPYVFQNGFNDTISGQGAKVECNIEDDTISIVDSNDQNYRFVAFRNSAGKLTFEVRNKGWGNQKHPLIYPGRLLEESINYFDNQGFPVEKIEGHWQGEGELTDNYNQFHQTFRATNDQQEAARQTWTGRQAQKLGFEVESIKQGEELGIPNISVIFRRKRNR